MKSRPRLQSHYLEIDGRKVACIRQRQADDQAYPRLLCVHGWLDNANSFVPMMPYLPSFDVVAIDMPGTGYSDPSPNGYSFPEMCYQLVRIIEALGWSSCHYVGHSLGGCIAPLLAVSKPDLIDSLTLIEASGPVSEEADQLPARMVRSMEDRLNPGRYRSRLFASKQEAIDARMKAAKMYPQSARLIIDRQLSSDTDGYRWRFDPRWRMHSPQYQTEAQVRSVLSSVSCRTLTIVADHGYLASRPETSERIACLENNQHVTLQGNHHLHMDTPEPVAAAINRFHEAVPDLGR